jgi:hypothetical protein
MKLGSETGSLMNHVMTGSQQPTPTVGMPATVCYWTDRHAGTVIKVTAKTITVQEDTATRVDSNGMSENQDYTYERNPNGRITVFRQNKAGAWRGANRGPGLVLGHRRSYHDFSF